MSTYGGGCELGVEKTAIERVEFDADAELLVAHVRKAKRECGRCGVCRRPSPGYDGGPGRRRWRALDLGAVRAAIEAETPRMRCRIHGVVVAAVPWARHDAGHTLAFDDQVAWLVTRPDVKRRIVHQRPDELAVGHDFRYCRGASVPV